jgi:hypothetical protein
MARKSKQQRIDEGNALIAAIKQDPVLASEQGWLLRFLNDLVAKFKRGKGGTKRQRELFDEKIAAGVPARKVNTHVAQPIVAEMQAALKVFSPFLPDMYAWEHRVLGEMYVKGLKYNLSEKQVKMAEDIVSRAAALEDAGDANTPEQIERIEYALKCVPYYSANFFYTQVKKSSAIKLAQAKVAKGVALTEGEIEAFEDACSGAIKKMQRAERKIINGSLMKTQVYNPETRQMDEKCALIVSDPYIPRKGSGIHVDTVVDGKVLVLGISKISKYTKKELKAMGV